MRTKALLLAGLALAGCGTVQGPSNIRWSGGETATPANADVSFYYAQGKRQLAAGNASLALDAFRKALRLDPKSIDALNGLGAAYDRIGRFDLSRNYYEQALGLDPASSITLNNFGYSLAMQGKREEAKEMLARATIGASDPVTTIAARNLASVAVEEKAAVAPAVQAAHSARPAPLIERLTTSTQLLVTRLMNVIASSAITSVNRDAASTEGEYPARYAAEYHRQRILLDPALLAQMGSDEITSGPAFTASLIVLNGVGRRGMAGRLAGFLTDNGYDAPHVGDTAPIEHSVILFPAEQSVEAAAIAAQLPFAVRLKPSTRIRSITLALGQDATRFDDRLRRTARSA